MNRSIFVKVRILVYFAVLASMLIVTAYAQHRFDMSDSAVDVQFKDQDRRITNLELGKIADAGAAAGAMERITRIESKLDTLMTFTQAVIVPVALLAVEAIFRLVGTFAARSKS